MAPPLILFWALGCGSAPVVDTSSSTEDSTPVEPFDPYAAGLVGIARIGEARYPARCATCHGIDGGGNLGPPLATVVPGKTDLELYLIITEGRDGMPAIGVTPQEGVNLVAYLQDAFGV